jgi:hypothetical protein
MMSKKLESLTMKEGVNTPPAMTMEIKADPAITPIYKIPLKGAGNSLENIMFQKIPTTEHCQSNKSENGVFRRNE